MNRLCLYLLHNADNRRYPRVLVAERRRGCSHPWQQECVARSHCVLYANPMIAQEEREYAIRSFKTGAKDVMVASGVASKGLDFNEIQHVIVYSMPKEIEDYVHQIGRTGRSGKTGIATTFINLNTSEQTLLDLKYLLKEAKQK